jgi:hypothetical protein
MYKFIKIFFIIFGILIFLTVSLILLYYILPKNYILRYNDNDSNKLTQTEKVIIKPNKEYNIDKNLINIDTETPLMIRGYLKDEKIINDPNTLIETDPGIIIQIKNNTDKDIEFNLYY